MAIAFRLQVDEDTEFALWKIEEDAETLYNQLQLNDDEKAYIESIGNGKRHLHWLGTRVLLRTMLNTSEYIDCRVDDHGKPYLVDMPYQISLSHSFDYAAVMISKSKAVGIDIELISPKVERIAHKFLNKQELATIQPSHRVEQLYVAWCAKEAVYKCNGRKVISFLDHIFLDPFEGYQAGHLQAKIIKDSFKKRYDVHYLRFEEYMIGYVNEGSDEE
ncbi:4'-phosphopantetheinyl transferase [Mucilaginibacter sp. PPCGB 2223]|uniref:4'-phosphopantetheinyl transferase family protein n=1 Tax=Mucilaginibacter sp. PPCGB 2223 TaxID=1886027 RepID=UPI00082453B9|nr:4'-phosphopantetheinyl transferase superfamily protein [Mucilaginibacter sp. PPCGB 2223]OCX50754.1 4'-phosphopantetheinyl transferase [Mucilaginibacter sp. PPCGB 2223]